jgi:hypothetical protein
VLGSEREREKERDKEKERENCLTDMKDNRIFHSTVKESETETVYRMFFVFLF